ncbi:AQP1 [Bugula neritina]|uniref:AQP1 n=1 Tax=Bugula neritina TaxID=10212 RepID=A0A7J7ISA7_BUGNE|nr:AQP1 [Bugula neritina]
MADLQDISGDSPMETDKFIDQGGYSKKRSKKQKMGIYSRFFESSAQDLKSGVFYKALLGEMLGVAFLVFVACSSVYGLKELDHVRISLSFGLSVATLVWLLANVSGGHINPAVTAGMFITRKVR